MQVKFFSAAGANDILRLEADINTWLQALPATQEVKRTDLAVGAVSSSVTVPQPYTVVTVWYDQK